MFHSPTDVPSYVLISSNYFIQCILGGNQDNPMLRICTQSVTAGGILSFCNFHEKIILVFHPSIKTVHDLGKTYDHSSVYYWRLCGVCVCV